MLSHTLRRPSRGNLFTWYFQPFSFREGVHAAAQPPSSAFVLMRRQAERKLRLKLAILKLVNPAHRFLLSFLAWRFLAISANTCSKVRILGAKGEGVLATNNERPWCTRRACSPPDAQRVSTKPIPALYRVADPDVRADLIRRRSHNQLEDFFVAKRGSSAAVSQAHATVRCASHRSDGRLSVRAMPEAHRESHFHPSEGKL